MFFYSYIIGFFFSFFLFLQHLWIVSDRYITVKGTCLAHCDQTPSDQLSWIRNSTFEDSRMNSAESPFRNLFPQTENWALKKFLITSWAFAKLTSQQHWPCKSDTWGVLKLSRSSWLKLWHQRRRNPVGLQEMNFNCFLICEINKQTKIGTHH